MKTLNPAVETWLNEFFLSLRSMPVSTKAELVTEMKSHILEKQGAAADTPVEELLKQIGDPIAVARSFVDESDERAQGSPSDHYHEQHQGDRKRWLLDVHGTRVRLFGGLIDVDGDAQKVRIGNAFELDGRQAYGRIGNLRFENADFLHGVKTSDFQRDLPLTEITAQTAKVYFGSGNLKLTWGDEPVMRLHWSGVEAIFDRVLELTRDGVKIDFEVLGPGKGEIVVPVGCRIEVYGGLGKITAHNPKGSGTLNMGNGRVVVLGEEPGQAIVSTDMGMGKVDPIPEHFKQESPNHINVSVGMGRISFHAGE